MLALRLVSLRFHLSEIGVDLRENLDRGGKTRFCRQRSPAELRFRRTGSGERRFGIAQVLPGQSVGLARLMSFGPGGGGAPRGDQPCRLGCRNLLLERCEAVSVAQLLGGG